MVMTYETRSVNILWLTMLSTIAEVVGKVNATDKDDPETDHVRIKYKLINGLDFFAINAETGVITTISKNLDREVSPAIALKLFDFVSLNLTC